MRLAALTLVSLVLLGACGEDEPTEPLATATNASAALDANGYPTGFTYPPGAEVEQTVPQHSLYIVRGSTTETIKDYWDPHLASLGFEELDSTDISRTYQRGTTTIQVTWNQAGDEVRGAANVLTP